MIQTTRHLLQKPIQHFWFCDISNIIWTTAVCHFSSFSESYVKHWVFNKNVRPQIIRFLLSLLLWFVFVLILKYLNKNSNVLCWLIFIALEKALNHSSSTITSIKCVMSLLINIVKIAPKEYNQASNCFIIRGKFENVPLNGSTFLVKNRDTCSKPSEQET